MNNASARYANIFNGVINPTATVQAKPIPSREKEMEKNNAGGYTFVIDQWSQLDRFLIMLE